MVHRFEVQLRARARSTMAGGAAKSGNCYLLAQSRSSRNGGQENAACWVAGDQRHKDRIEYLDQRAGI